MNFEISDYPKNYLSEKLLNIAWGKENNHLYPFVGTASNIAAVENNIRNFFDIPKRKLLYDILLRQNSDLDLSENQVRNLKLILQENTFTVTTGQQLHVGLGPMYVWNKIESVLNTVSILSNENPACNYIPIYWMASEDHDFDEIKDVQLFGESYLWETTEKGPVGLYKTQSLNTLFNTIKTKFINDEQALKRLQLVEEMYVQPNVTLAEATRNLVHFIFSETGLLILDPNDRDLKAMCISLWMKDIVQREIYPEIIAQNQVLIQNNFDTPAYAREINCFYIEPGIRERIEWKDGNYQLVDSKKQFSESEMIHIIQNNPQCISPNVLLRGLFQQSILPNAVYIGGPAEFAYWMQNTKAFEVSKIPAPRLQLRFSSVYLPSSVNKKLSKLKLNESDMWNDWVNLELKIIALQKDEFLLDKEIKTLEMNFDSVRKSLYNLKSPQLKDMKKLQEDMVKELKKISADYKTSPETAGQLAKDLQTAKQLKSEYFDVKNPQERRLFWLELYLKCGLLKSNDFSDNLICFLVLQ